MGTVSKTLAPALRLGWLVLPARLRRARSRSRSCSPTTAAPTLDQLALARLIESGAYDRHLRQARRRYRARRDALVAAVARHLPGARVTGRGGGPARDRAPRPRPSTASRSCRRPRATSVGVYPLGYAYMEPRPVRRRPRARLRQPGRAGDRGGRPAAGAAALRGRCAADARPAAPPAGPRRRTRAARSRGSGRTPSAPGAAISNARTIVRERAARRDLPDGALALSSQRYLRACASENAP